MHTHTLDIFDPDGHAYGQGTTPMGYSTYFHFSIPANAACMPGEV